MESNYLVPVPVWLFLAGAAGRSDKSEEKLILAVISDRSLLTLRAHGPDGIRERLHLFLALIALDPIPALL